MLGGPTRFAVTPELCDLGEPRCFSVQLSSLATSPLPRGVTGKPLVKGALRVRHLRPDSASGSPPGRFQERGCQRFAPGDWGLISPQDPAGRKPGHRRAVTDLPVLQVGTPRPTGGQRPSQERNSRPPSRSPSAPSSLPLLRPLPQCDTCPHNLLA